MNADATTRKFPPVKQPQRYAPTGREPGYDGEPPVHMVKRDLDGKGKRSQEQSIENINIDRVTYLFHYKHIDERQFLAAQRLETDWEMARIDPIASQVLVGASGGGPELPQDAKVAAMKRHGAAMKALGRSWPMVERVVHDHKSVAKASAELGVHRQVGMGVLWAALNFLADHYAIS